jgi:hypothetical protein
MGKKDNRHSTDTNTQNKRLYSALIKAHSQGLTSYQVREELDIYCPTARITDLRKAGNEIYTIWDVIDTGKGKHRVARWVLMRQAQEAVA